MSKWLTSLVRARQLQEDAAKQQLAQSRHRATVAQRHVRYNEDRVASLTAAGAEAAAPAFVAAAVALQAAAATHSAALRVAEAADVDVENRRDDLANAAVARRGVEAMEERVIVAEKQRAAQLAQRDLDEVAARMHRDERGAS